MISLIQFILAVLVVIFHCSRIFPSDEWHFFQKSILSRLAVPFFMIVSAFFIRWKGAENPFYQKYYYKNYLKNYLWWSLLYIPYGYTYFLSLELPMYLLPLGILFALLYIGMCYQLWYLIAFLTGSWLVERFRQSCSLLVVTGMAFLLYLVGSVETYAGYLEETPLMPFFSKYLTLFFTTRNGLFFAPIFICVGYLLYEYRKASFFSEKAGSKLLFSFFFLVLEGVLVFKNPGIDKNFLITLVPTSLFLFNWSIRTTRFSKRNFHKLKQLSMLYFFIHPIFIEILFRTSLESRVSFYQYGWLSVLFTLTCTHATSECILWLQEKKWRPFPKFKKA
ncbi:acyltransferase family protein [Enterococcus sp. LJL98]